MKTNKRITALLAAAFLVMTSAWAGGEITVVKMLNGTVNENAGSASYELAATNNMVTLSVTPATANYVSQVTAERTITGGMAQAPSTEPGIDDNAITVTPSDMNTDPSGRNSYTFQMPDSEYDVVVTVYFASRTSIANATVTLLDVPDGGFTYDSEAKEPGLTVSLDNTTLTENDYTVAYSNNVNAGTATITVSGVKTYTGTATQTFTIQKASLEFSVSIEGWTLGSQANSPFVEGLPEEIMNPQVTYSYKAKGEDFYMDPGLVPQQAGEWTVKAVVAESDNYQAGEATYDFEIVYRTLTEGEDVSFVGNQQWATYFNADETLLLPKGILAYVVTAIDGSQLTLQNIGGSIPQGVAVLLERNSDAQPAEGGTYEMNLLMGTATATDVTAITDGTVYVLYNGMFVKSLTGEIPANKAYLVLAASADAPAPKFLTFDLSTTGIEGTGQLDNWTIGQINHCYDLSGRQVVKSANGRTAKGIFIVNGKKLVVK
jgi:hypothetical protein